MKAALLSISALAMAIAANAGQPNFVELSASELPSGLASSNFRGNMVFVDFNNDGRQDLLYRSRNIGEGWASAMGICFSSEEGLAGANKDCLKEVSNLGSNDWHMVVAPIDFNGDGLVDILLYGEGSYRTAMVLKNCGLVDGVPVFEQAQSPFVKAETWTDDNGNPTSNYCSFCDADGNPIKDLSISDNYAETHNGNNLYAVGDFNNDGIQDIVTIHATMTSDEDDRVFGNFALFLGDGKGAFILKADHGITAARNGGVACGDINNDGILDIVVCGYNDDKGKDITAVCLGNGDGTFREANLDVAGAENGSIHLLDYNADGNLDIFITGEDSGNGWQKRADIFFGNGDGTFTAANLGLAGTKVGSADWCDLNNDGYIDIIYNGEIDDCEGAALVINSDGKTADAQYDSLSGVRSGATVAIADFYGDDEVSLADVAMMGYPRGSGECVVIAENMARTSGPTGIKTSFKNAVAPSNLNMTSSGNSVTFSWDAGADDVTAEQALRYNVYVKFTDGSIAYNTPANIETGFVLTNRIDAALTTRCYTINRAASEIAEWGVQTINQGRLGSAFAKEGAGIAGVTVDADVVATEYYNIMGQRLDRAPQTGLYIQKSILSNGAVKAEKVVK